MNSKIHPQLFSRREGTSAIHSPESNLQWLKTISSPPAAPGIKDLSFAAVQGLSIEHPQRHFWHPLTTLNNAFETLPPLIITLQAPISMALTFDFLPSSALPFAQPYNLPYFSVLPLRYYVQDTLSEKSQSHGCSSVYTNVQSCPTPTFVLVLCGSVFMP